MCWHKWSKWVTVSKGKLVKDFGPFCNGGSTSEIGRYEYQERICEKCGKKQLQKIVSI